MGIWSRGAELTCEVSSVRPGGAAWRAGLRTGDEIIAMGSRTRFYRSAKGVTLGDPAQGINSQCVDQLMGVSGR